MKQVSRREAIKTIALGAAFSNVIGNSWAASLLFDIRALAHVREGVLQIKLSDFPELAQAGGSIRIGTSPVVRNSSEEIRQAGIFPPIIINRGDANDFHVLSAECTHAGCSIQRMDAQTREMSCPCHGSRYNMQGAVTNGPANQPLSIHAFTLAGDVLSIRMPDVFYEIAVSRVPSASRVEVTFLGFSQIIYEMYFRTTLTGPVEKVAFATTASGPMDQTEIPGADDFAKIYVERPGKAGFYQVAMKAGPV